MIVNNVNTSYYWGDDKYIQKQFHVTTFENGQRVQSTVEYVLYDRRGKEVKDLGMVNTIDKLV